MHTGAFLFRAAILAAVAIFQETLAPAQSPTNLNALQGLLPVSTLNNTDAGRAALVANLFTRSAK